jgi:hypothetical protein
MVTRKTKAPSDGIVIEKPKRTRKPKADPNNLTKEEATLQKLPWVKVLQTHVDQTNPRNGFFELDWNEYFVLNLKKNGYPGSTDEEIVDGWFKVLCAGIAQDEEVNMERRGVGYINVNNLGNGRSEVS